MNAAPPTFVVQLQTLNIIAVKLCFRFGLHFVIREVLRRIKTQFQFRVSELFSAVPPAYLPTPGSPFCFATSATRIGKTPK